MTAQRADASSSRDTMKPASSTQSSTSYLTLDTIWSHEKTNLLQGRYFDINRNQSLDQYAPPITPITLHYITKRYTMYHISQSLSNHDGSIKWLSL